MMHISAIVLLLLAAPAFAQTLNVPQNAATAPCSTYLCDVQVDWLRNNGMVGIAAFAMPEDKYGFKPTPAQQTFGERVLHVAEINYWLLGTLGAKTPPPQVNFKATKKDEILASLRAVTEYGTAVLKEYDEAGLKERVAAPEFMGPMSSRARIVYFLMSHAQDTYGQLVVYLRLNGIVPPLSRQP